MPTLSATEAVERLAKGVEKARPPVLAEIWTDNFPDYHPDSPPSATDLARHVRDRLEADEIVDLWNVVFPEDHNVWFNEETNEIHFNEEVIDYADVD